MQTYKFHTGTLPILVSMPHNGSLIPENIASNMHDYALSSVDTDWYLDRLYQFALEMGCYVIEPIYSRYVIDLNRSPDDSSLYPGADTTELCPTSQFDKRPLYLPNQTPSKAEIKDRTQNYWMPYHQKIQQTISEIKSKFGCVLLYEAHSIRSKVPRFFEGQLPDFNFGTNDGKTVGYQL
ncbi:MAG: N-formylglutamate amidohydrolase, partial [Gammaproteobacteria bacterium]|nr:N-formylglutamate amidohydrolase [Gammaproteobacteria bacterium]